MVKFLRINIVKMENIRGTEKTVIWQTHYSIMLGQIFLLILDTHFDFNNQYKSLNANKMIDIRSKMEFRGCRCHFHCETIILSMDFSYTLTAADAKNSQRI